MSVTDRQPIPFNYHQLSPQEKRVVATNAILGVIAATASGGGDYSAGLVERSLEGISPLIDTLQDAINVTR